MPKGVKIALAVILPLMVILGVVYGLAKFGVLPARKYAQKNNAMGKALRMIGLGSPRLPARQVNMPAPVDPLAAEKKALAAERDALTKERAALQAQPAQPAALHNASDTKDAASATAPPDPKEVARLASVYEQMSPDALKKIFDKLPDDQVIALLRRMDEKQVAEFLALETPERAARLTITLSHPAPADHATTL